MRQHLVLMSRFDPHEFLPLITDHRVTFLTTVPTIMQRRCRSTRPTRRLRPVVDPAVLASGAPRARRPSSRRGSTCSDRRRFGNSTAAPNYRR